MAETTASVFMSGRSQAVRIPKAFWIDSERVTIRKRGESLVLTPVKKEDQWAALREVVAVDDGTDWGEILRSIEKPLTESSRLPMDYHRGAYADYEHGEGK